MIIYSQKYYTKYNQIVKHYKDLDLKKSKDLYTESHHIIPRSMGGDNSRDNLVRVPSRVHFLLHWMLYRIYRTPETAYAWNMMSMNRSSKRYISKSFEYAKTIRIYEMTGRTLSSDHREKISKSLIGNTRRLGSVVSEEQRVKMSSSNKGKIPANKGKPISNETRINISNAVKGKTLGVPKSPEHRAKISAAKIGKVHSEEAKRNMSKAGKKKIFTDEHRAAISAAKKSKS